MTQPCVRCGQQLAPDAEYCLNCGTRPQPSGASSSDHGHAGPDATVVPPASGGAVTPPVYGGAVTPPAYGGAVTPPVYGGAVVPPAYVAQGAGASGPQFLTPSPAPKRTGRFVVLGLGVVGLLAVGLLALRFLTGGDATGGASSPDAVVEDMVAAINAQDPLAVVDLMAPDELDGVDTLVTDLTDLYRNLGLEDLAEAQGAADAAVTIALEADRIDVEMEGDKAAIVSFELSGRLDIEGGDDELMDTLDIGDSVSFDSRDLEGALPNGTDQVALIAVELDGRWYASPMLTAGHYIVENSDLPPGDYSRIGEDRETDASSPEEAVQALVDVINDPDADGLAAALGGGEGRVATVFRDAIDQGLRDIDSSSLPYEVTVRTSDLGDGRVGLDEIEIRVEDDFSSGSVTIKDGCATVREDGESADTNCLSDVLDAITDEDVDTSIVIETVDEDGGPRVRIIPSVTGLLDRFVKVINDRQRLLYLVDAMQYDDATTVGANSDTEIAFDGDLYAVHEFAVEAGEAYNVTATGDRRIDLFVDDGFGLSQIFDGEFVATEDGMAKVVTLSDPDLRCDSDPCLPTGEGETTLRIRQAPRQTVAFPQVIRGDLGPGDVREFDLEVESDQLVRIDVTGDTVEWRLTDEFMYSAGDGTYQLPAGTYEFVVYNTDAEASTGFAISPSAG